MHLLWLAINRDYVSFFKKTSPCNFVYNSFRFPLEISRKLIFPLFFVNFVAASGRYNQSLVSLFFKSFDRQLNKILNFSFRRKTKMKSRASNALCIVSNFLIIQFLSEVLFRSNLGSTLNFSQWLQPIALVRILLLSLMFKIFLIFLKYLDAV